MVQPDLSGYVRSQRSGEIEDHSRGSAEGVAGFRRVGAYDHDLLYGGRMSTLTYHLVTREIADEFPDMGVVSPQTLGGTYGALHIAVEDADAVWDRAMRAGATVFEPLHDAFWGDRTGQFIDPFGHRWPVDQHLRDVPHDEVVRLAAAAFGGGDGDA